MNRLTRMLQRPPTQSRSAVSFMAEQAFGNDMMFAAGGVGYYGQPQLSMNPIKVDTPKGEFESLVGYVSENHGVIPAAVFARSLLLSEMRFQWRSLLSQDNGRLFGSAELGVLEHPNPSQTRAELLTLAENHVSWGGNAFFRRTGNEIRLLNPGWTSIVLGSNRDPAAGDLASDATVTGYLYKPGGPSSRQRVEMIDAAEVAHWKPEPDPIYWWRGRSWIASCLDEWGVDHSAWLYMKSFFENAATPQMMFTADPSVTKEQMKEYAEVIREDHTGPWNAFKSLIIGGGVTGSVVGVDPSRLDMKVLQGLTETRVSARARIPAAILGISEGLRGSALNGNSYDSTRRTWSDIWFTPTASGLCAVLEKIVPPPSAAAELSFDPSRIMFLQDDRNDEAEIVQKRALTIRQLIDAGFKPETAVPAVTNGDFSVLKHSGLFSVQLQPPTTSQPDPAAVTPVPAKPAMPMVGAGKMPMMNGNTPKTAPQRNVVSKRFVRGSDGNIDIIIETASDGTRTRKRIVRTEDRDIVGIDVIAPKGT